MFLCCDLRKRDYYVKNTLNSTERWAVGDLLLAHCVQRGGSWGGSAGPIFTLPCDLPHAIPWPHVILSSAQIQIYLRTNHIGKQRKQIV